MRGHYEVSTVRNSQRNDRRLVVITGMSGAGKTVAIQSFEDMGYFCVDNLPSTLLPKFLELMEGADSEFRKVAVVMDLRGGTFFGQLPSILNELKKANRIQVQILFLDAHNETLVRRYKETRRAHPLAPNELPLTGIELERRALADLKEMAKYIFVTSNMKPQELREKITIQFAQDQQRSFQILMMSFGYKHGIPIDSDLVFDVRFIPNPFYIEELRPLTGLDVSVSSYVKKWKETTGFMERCVGLLDFVVPHYQSEGKAQLVIAIGCTGGQHRSVTIAEMLHKHFLNTHKVSVFHRDIHKKKLQLHD